LKGKLLLVHGLIDDNVHPSNTWQLSQKLHDENKRFDMMIYPNFQHGIGSTYRQLTWEYLINNLKPEPMESSATSN
jgi:dipeptidyl aminopeptidase/acylaminoacyl peptidase